MNHTPMMLTRGRLESAIAVLWTARNPLGEDATMTDAERNAREAQEVSDQLWAILAEEYPNEKDGGNAGARTLAAEFYAERLLKSGPAALRVCEEQIAALKRPWWRRALDVLVRGDHLE